MASDDQRRRKAREKRKSLKIRGKTRYSDLIVAVPFIVFVGILIIIYGPFGGGGPAPDFSLEDVQGRGMITLSAHKGKVVFIEFFSTTCHLCEQYLTNVQQIRTLYSNEDLVIISISVDWVQETEAVLRTYAMENSIQWYIAPDTSTVTDDYDVSSTPTTIIVDKSGNIAFKQAGVISVDDLSSEIDDLL